MDAGKVFPSVELDCQIAAALVTFRIEQLGLRVMRSFDLRTAACVSRPDEPCPHHGTSPCDCQMVVLLIYGQEGPPLSLVAHGHDRRTGFYLVEDPAQPADAAAQALVRKAFDNVVKDMEPASTASRGARTASMDHASPAPHS